MEKFVIRVDEETYPLPEPKKLGRPIDGRKTDIVYRAAADYQRRKYATVQKAAEAYLKEYWGDLSKFTSRQIISKKHHLTEKIEELLLGGK